MAGPSSVGGLSTREGGGPVSGDPEIAPRDGRPQARLVGRRASGFERSEALRLTPNSGLFEEVESHAQRTAKRNVA